MFLYVGHPDLHRRIFVKSVYSRIIFKLETYRKTLNSRIQNTMYPQILTLTVTMERQEQEKIFKIAYKNVQKSIALKSDSYTTPYDAA